jgi:hypothetical protein
MSVPDAEFEFKIHDADGTWGLVSPWTLRAWVSITQDAEFSQWRIFRDEEMRL